jgi:plasmid replication initiation protein
MAITKGISRKIKKRIIMSRIDTLRNRYDRINRLRNIAINERNILKKHQAQWLLYSITATLNLISQPNQWN